MLYKHYAVLLKGGLYFVRTEKPFWFPILTFKLNIGNFSQEAEICTAQYDL